MNQPYLALIVAFLSSVGLATLIVLLSNWLGPRRPSAVKSDLFECGNPPSGSAPERFNVKFFVVAILFLVFDVEAVFLYPWALLLHDALQPAASNQAAAAPLEVATLVAQMAGFAALLTVGLVYVWRKGALAWSRVR